MLPPVVVKVRNGWAGIPWGEIVDAHRGHQLRPRRRRKPIAPRSSRLPWLTRTNSPPMSQAWPGGGVPPGRHRGDQPLGQVGGDADDHHGLQVLLEGGELRALAVDAEVARRGFRTART
ncbi:MAG: hypothetical protein WDO13_04615 [Verrucomicrobiota bacterium]